MNQHEAHQHVKQLKHFYCSLSKYAKVIGILFVIDLLSGGGWWFHWVAIIWGLVLLVRAIQTFNIFPNFDQAWEERKIREIMERDDKPKRKSKNDIPSDDYFEDDVF
jgi:2TM domain